jgi:PIN domain nuclease of toxin-antitoxin system
LSVLIDSHALIWWLCGNPRLSRRAREAITAGPAYVSVASAYEIGLKVFNGKWPEAEKTIETFAQTCEVNALAVLPVSLDHALKAAGFEADHRDPFDRLLAAQSLLEDLPLVTIDPAFRLFGCKTVW